MMMRDGRDVESTNDHDSDGILRNHFLQRDERS
jgi:hypothetical protein